MPQRYKRLARSEREEISIGLARGDTASMIAKRLGRRPSTVVREAARRGRDGYRAHAAQTRADIAASSRRRGKTKLRANRRLERYVLGKLGVRWSPEQISRSLTERYPHDMTMRISDETIYRYIYVLPRGELKRRLIKALRQERKYRRKLTPKGLAKAETRGKLADMLSIEERPAEVADRIVPGHWEGDLIIGLHRQSAIGTLVERTTRYVIIVPLPTKDAVTVRQAFAREIRTLPKELRKTLTYDQGKEMSEHKKFTLSTGMQVYFAHPSSPWERGTNENTNMLIRQYYPKGTDFRKVTAKDIKRVQRELNGRPRQSLDFRTPQETFRSLLR